MSPADAKNLWADVQANQARWEFCPGPHVLVDTTPDKQLGKRWRCSLCGGECNSVEKYHYEQGLQHGRRGE